MKAKSNSGYGSGWHFQSQRHSQARRTGRAGGYYALMRNKDMTAKIIKTNQVPTKEKYPEFGFAEGKYKTKKEALDRAYALGYKPSDQKRITEKNLFLKTRPIDKPYEVWVSPDGQFETRVLKKYQIDDEKPYARWYTATKSPATFGSWEYGDMYVKDIKQSMKKKE